jgi:RNA polymerase sigma factor (sigma-70 family)
LKGTDQDTTRWPLRLRELCQKLQSGRDSQDRQLVRNEIWTILGHSLQRYLESHRSSHAGLTEEDVEDLASEKSLDLIRKLESGRWEIGERTGPEIAGFLATTARNGLVDLLRRPARRRQVRVAASDPAGGGPNNEDLPCWDTPDAPLERKEFISALRGCAESLQPRVRRIWFFRVFYDLAAKEIAAHPDVGLKPARVDELLFNARQAIRQCMESKGQRLRQLPTGTFFEVWKSFRGIQLEEVGTHGQALDVPL